MKSTFYALSLLLAYAFIEWRGINFIPNTTSSQVPKSVRSTSGYRTYQAYHGYHGGK